jgi:hypothetical protein
MITQEIGFENSPFLVFDLQPICSSCDVGVFLDLLSAEPGV